MDEATNPQTPLMEAIQSRLVVFLRQVWFSEVPLLISEKQAFVWVTVLIYYLDGGHYHDQISKESQNHFVIQYC